MPVRFGTARGLFLAVGLSLVGSAAARIPSSSDTPLQSYETAAARGNRGAAKTLGLLLIEGLTIEREPVEGMRWLTSSASAGDLEAQIALADVYRAGPDAQRNPAEAARWYQAASAHSAYAAWRLGQMLEAGLGVPVDLEQMLRLYRQAAEMGFAAAENSMGSVYLAGIGVPQDYGKAREWYERAAEGGYADALLNLAGLYYQGLGVEQSYPRAAQLAHTAARQHARDAAAFVQEIERKMDGAESRTQ